ncbi:type IV pilus modification protein PilV [Biformimicrobium ophioploci]|uniref:Type IV pilin Tt1218-like domain-containing protein n=1 Tax=Biformimicrobium ophioploci TaxID=3036711 RepID=A0ABQ6M2S8_9GAMM|nr:type IV pilus modification protein PilV [Microbulbifer sp. NKW57]GMG88580.1 hypothetical protein MNKW57_29010 [Microbulbifer sp. NKW57]
MTQSFKQQRGATLIEVLITVLVMAIGLLGLGATQMLSLKNGNNAHHRFMAASAAQDLVERMRANPDGVELGGYSDKSVNGTESVVSCTATCSASELANMDLYEWGQLIDVNLPDAVGTVDVDGAIATISVGWKEQNTQGRSAEATDDSAFTMQVEL